MLTSLGDIRLHWSLSGGDRRLRSIGISGFMTVQSGLWLLRFLAPGDAGLGQSR